MREFLVSQKLNTIEERCQNHRCSFQEEVTEANGQNHKKSYVFSSSVLRSGEAEDYFGRELRTTEQQDKKKGYNIEDLSWCLVLYSTELDKRSESNAKLCELSN